MTSYSPTAEQVSFPNVICTGSDTYTFDRHLAKVRVRQTRPDDRPDADADGFWFVTVDGTAPTPAGPRVEPGNGAFVTLTPPAGDTTVRISKWPPLDHDDIGHYVEPAQWDAMHATYGLPTFYSLEVLDSDDDTWPAGTPSA